MPSGPGHPARLRLTMDREGRVEWTDAALPPAKAEWRVGLAQERLRSDDPWLRVKSTRREAYDRARAALPEGLDEVLFLNERGEVCDGSITSVFVDRGQGMRTPPLSSGLLPGVLRAELGCAEEVLRAEDLPGVRLWVGNALRGLIPAVFILD
jgi:4-amino-4-deoxychorismate lyase